MSVILAWTMSMLASEPRTMQLHYRPITDGSVECVNGSKMYNRALYGAHSGFRVECSDMPVFGIYLPHMGGNLSLTLPSGDCVATYTPGKMTYQQGSIEVEAQVLRSDDAAIWRITNQSNQQVDIPVRFGGVADKSFSRNGDLGVDPPDCFELKDEYCKGNIYTVEGENVTIEYGKKERKELALVLPTSSHHIDELPSYHGIISLQPSETKYIALTPAHSNLRASNLNLAETFAQAEAERIALASTMTITTPDEWINPIGEALGVAADGIWSGEAWLHGSIGWRTPYAGWRGAYIGDALGWYDRAEKHFDTYANNQVSDVPATISHPTQDPTQAMARAEKKWGTQMYSNGYICRRPGKKDEMSHYDMNLVYIDALLRHLRTVGDTVQMRRYYPVIKRHLDWEKRNYDPDGDNLYDAYCCIWASDALYYSGGAVTHSSAYNAFANSNTALIARELDETDDFRDYFFESLKILEPMLDCLWLEDIGVWAEYREYFDHSRLHDSPGLWTIYHAIDSRTAAISLGYAATRYIDREIPHIPFRVEGDTTIYHTLASTSWMPYSWSINNVAIAEVMHTALAYWQVDRPDDAFHLMKSVAMDNMYTGASPLNFGQVSQFDTARGECYRDFADPIGVWGRAITEGLFGIEPNAFEQTVSITPGFPSDWDHASISLPQIQYSFRREGNVDRYEIQTNYPTELYPVLVAPANGKIKSVRCNGEKANYYCPPEGSFNRPRIEILPSKPETNVVVEIETEGELLGVYQCELGGKYNTGPVHISLFKDGDLEWYEVTESELPSITAKYDIPDSLDEVDWNHCVKIDISDCYNARVSDIFRQEYNSPRPTATTLQIPLNGIGDWCHPIVTADIQDPDSTSLHNIAFVSLWDNYPDSIQADIDINASNLYAMVAGSTNHMQHLMPNAEIKLVYEDGSTMVTTIVPPLNYAPIEQDFYIDGAAFSIPDGRQPPMRVHLPTGQASRNLGDILGITGVDGRRIPGGAGVKLQLRHDPNKTVKSLRLRALAPDIVIGLMGLEVGS